MPSEEKEHIDTLNSAQMSRKRSKQHMKELSRMPREAPITQGPAEFDERTKLRVHILSMRLFPNLYNADFLRRGS